MNGDFDILRENLRREVKRVGYKTVESVSGIDDAILYLVIGGKREFRESHLDGISSALGIPLAHLFMPPDQLERMIQEDSDMRQIREVIDLMLRVPEIKNAILYRIAGLKKEFKDEIERASKKAALQPVEIRK
jgi:hypothetical protein